MARRRRQSRSFHRTCQGPRQGQGSSRLIGDQADHLPREVTPGAEGPLGAPDLSRDRACPRAKPAGNGPPRHLPRPARAKRRRPRQFAKPSRLGSSPRAKSAGSGPPRLFPDRPERNAAGPARSPNRAAEGRGTWRQAAFRPRREDHRPSSEQIAIHAYHLWLAQGRPVGTDWDDWLEAERRLAASA